jgi:hypothetical protein
VVIRLDLGSQMCLLTPSAQVTQSFIDFLKRGTLKFEVYGHYEGHSLHHESLFASEEVGIVDFAAVHTFFMVAGVASRLMEGCFFLRRR